MRLLLTSDLHRDGKKLLWLFDHAPEHDALLVAGDLLDIFSSVDFAEQHSGAVRWKEAFLRSKKSMAWCSGNHDFFHGEDALVTIASPRWMREQASTDSFVTDGESRLLATANGKLAVTTIPWPVYGVDHDIEGRVISYPDLVEDLLEAGQRLQKEEGVPWIVLNHEPPGRTPLSATHNGPEADFARQRIYAAQPDFSLHGHIHQAPSAEGGSWIWKLGKTICFNAGQSGLGEPLHYIVLELRETGDWTAIWHGNGQTCQVESKRWESQ